jgi:hypothetical protein
VEATPIDERRRRQIVSGNARRLFRLPVIVNWQGRRR